ncbi:heme-degrading monooxygenase HmoA [Streptomyces sp. 3211.6]|uniref:antibiotic biosynthesis monooxygenase family protein n=1 Tax=Streptomyces TaxID=1883 RepID=UPI0009A51C58|nr:MULTISPECIES: antibiotic biosynthesis monooxygenase [Streptomyces]RKT05806.1 heme-degrading monooxygenase HmoA [Streptomyces sp. 3211.6]RPF41742.1 heme-degrading monooxygenase HmoA [Streptomyces sp. Ag109_G2-6]
MSIQPVPAFEPPYVMAVFSSVRTSDDSGYPETLARMAELVRDNPGFLGYESARTPGGLGITVSYFRDHESLAAWRTELEHQAAMKQGRGHWYESYTLHVATVERSHGFARDA